MAKVKNGRNIMEVATSVKAPKMLNFFCRCEQYHTISATKASKDKNIPAQLAGYALGYADFSLKTAHT